MRGSSDPQTLQTIKQSIQSRRYPVSARAYKKKDHDYLSTFPRMANPVALRASTRHDDVELSHEQSDLESDIFTTASSINEYATSVSSASSTSSSIKSLAKYGSPLTDMESNPQHQSHSHHDRPHRHHHHHRQHQEDHHLQVKETSTLSAPNIMENTDLQEVDDEKLGSELKTESKDSKSDLSGSGENDSVEVKGGPIKVRAKVRSRHVDTPAVLPKFGSWDTKNPSSGEAYTLIFRRLRDEKKSGGVPVCGSPTHPKAEEEPDESLRPESKAKEPLCPKPRTGKDPSRRKAKPTSHHDAAHSRRRWILCCKTSVLED